MTTPAPTTDTAWTRLADRAASISEEAADVAMDAYLLGIDRATDRAAAANQHDLAVLERTRAALSVVRRALAGEPRTCRYHGTDFERSDMAFGLPRCDSCKQPYRVAQALAALARIEGSPAPPQGGEPKATT